MSPSSKLGPTPDPFRCPFKGACKQTKSLKVSSAAYENVRGFVKAAVDRDVFLREYPKRASTVVMNLSNLIYVHIYH